MNILSRTRTNVLEVFFAKIDNSNLGFIYYSIPITICKVFLHYLIVERGKIFRVLGLAGLTPEAIS